MQTIETILLFPLTWVAVTFAYVVYGQWRMLRLSKRMGEVGRAAQPLFPPPFVLVRPWKGSSEFQAEYRALLKRFMLPLIGLFAVTAVMFVAAARPAA
jgi:hypothetical protein